MLRLVAATGASLQIDREPVVIGRDPGADVHLDDRSVSRRHARLYREDGAWRVEDLKSANGTFVDGNRVTIAPLANGQEVRLGEAAFRVGLADVDPRATVVIPVLAATPAVTPVAPPTAKPPLVPPPASALPPPPPMATPPPYAAAATLPPPGTSRPSSGGGGLGKLLLAAVVLYFGYQHFTKAGRPGAETAGPATGQGIRIASLKVEKDKDEDGDLRILIRCVADGFASRKVERGYQVAVEQDIETVGADGQRIDGLSKEKVNVVNDVIATERTHATLDFSFSVKPGASGTLTARVRVRDTIGGTRAEDKIDIPLP